MDIDQAQKQYDNELPDFEDYYCEVEDCDEDGENFYCGHSLCDSCFNEVLSNPRGDIAMSVLGRVR